MMKTILAHLLCLSAIGAAHAYDPLEDRDSNDYAPPTEQWREEAITLPETFDPDDLQRFTLKGDNDRFT
ncbi:MAG: hypothetical protein PVI92_09180, partial [Chromatiales bacterium]